MADEVVQGAESTPAAAAVDGALDLAVVRDLVLKANPNVVAELVTGASAAELLASVSVAEAAYQRIAQSVQPAAAVVVGEPAAPVVIVTEPVSVGSPPRSQGPDVEALSPHAKIRLGIEQRGQA